MKMSKENYEYLKEKIKPFDTEEWRQAYRDASFSARRYRWDLFWASGVKIGDGVGLSGDIIESRDFNDDHLDTALRNICGMDKSDTIPPLGGELK